ncbi:PAS domain-containing protein [Aurantibacter crassamenti]|uniref:LuxR C-terminal-related transcriptional regulator n=1 Tax=Aurantibacter crassamenti TaxID=1837375 RepID=UPI00193AC334|nr:LuxR C-terminal-related transcriptional regulator [Aurantibacter crassamenti]MBM1105429.1 PAS domain-containing protein [Aurantibacter crassamenti]
MDLEFYANIFSTDHKVEKAVLKKHIEKLEELDQYLPRLQSFIMVQDTVNQTFEYVCDNYEKLLGYNKQEVVEQGMAFHFTKIHPEDIPNWMKILNDLMQYTMTHVNQDDRINCVYYWNYRLKNAKSEYVNIQVHQTPLFFDEQGKPILGYSQNTILGNSKKQPMIGVCKKLNSNNEYETLFYKNYSEALLIDNLSNRELDIVRLLAKGNTTKEISTKLNISIHTTATHRKNILSKLKFNSSSEIINYCNENHLF